jgi:hypothetical protein
MRRNNLKKGWRRRGKNLIRVINQKSVVAYNIESYCRKAVCPDLLATLPNVFDFEIAIIFANNC